MKGIYVVEAMFDYSCALSAHKTKEDAEAKIKEMKKENPEWWSRHKPFITYYEFGQDFDNC